MIERVVAITVPYPGVQQWLEHGERVGLWQLLELGNHVHKIPDVDAVVERADWILLGAWHPAYQHFIEYAKKTDTRVAVAWSSSATEMEHAPTEIQAVHDLTQSGSGIDAWLCLNQDLVDHFPNAIHLPAPIHMEPAIPVAEKTGIGFYCPATLKKNIFPQLLAIRGFQHQFDGPSESVHLSHLDHPIALAKTDPRVHLYTNLEPYRGVLQAYDIKHTLEGWVDRQAHLMRLAARRVCMAASHAESFCYGAVDAMMMDTPVVGSPTLDWLPAYWCVQNPNSPQGIQRALTRVWDDQNSPREFLQDCAEANNSRAKQAIEDLLAQ